MPRLFNDPASGLTLPVRGDPPSGSPVITQGYGPENTDPSVRHLYLKGYHTGIDIAGVPEGSPVVCAWDGVVTIARVFEGKGNTVGVTRPDGLLALYGHMHHIDVTEGATVSVGDVLGGVGQTGVSEGVHLHYEIRQDGTDIDPTPFMKTGGGVVAAGGGSGTRAVTAAGAIRATVREALRLRGGASTDAAILLTAAAGSAITIGQSGWVPVTCDGREGWMFGEFLDFAENCASPTGVAATVRESLRMRADPSTDAEILLTAAPGTVVTIGRGGFVPVTCDGNDGWMFAEFLTVPKQP